MPVEKIRIRKAMRVMGPHIDIETTRLTLEQAPKDPVLPFLGVRAIAQHGTYSSPYAGD
jgi:hypothetical protein